MDFLDDMDIPRSPRYVRVMTRIWSYRPWETNIATKLLEKLRQNKPDSTQEPNQNIIILAKEDKYHNNLLESSNPDKRLDLKFDTTRELQPEYGFIGHGRQISQQIYHND